ncbi:hypothetical protein K3148_11790 [Qipengyuania aurantiaca]|uniref:Uncharacterized protein n=1 Tax=Qipengyuania aurantiaca TaxID=2867233 RepID=A0ABX8ZPI4_9SPHN|nr:hypothetical protein [Qipengyuania aurantiaca]QZD89482.1 hypothetical protein K3148_11790 [Qipengyuania aurantiaca]
MRFALPVLALATFAAPAFANEPEEKKDEKPEAQEPAKTEEKKICRFVQMDTSSRRREKVCLTKEGWIAFNNGN